MYESSSKCSILSKVSLVVGLIISVACAYSAGLTVSYEKTILSSGEIVHSRNWLTTILVFALFAFVTYVVYISLSVLSDICATLGSLYESVKLLEKRSDGPAASSDSPSYGAGNSNPIPRVASAPEDTWRCPKCGRTNPKSSTICKDCGTYR